MSLRPNCDITEIAWRRNRLGQFQVTFTTSPLDIVLGGRAEAQELADDVGLTLVENEGHCARWVRDAEGWPVSTALDQSPDAAG